MKDPTSKGIRLIIFGPPGAGKGTYASRLAPKLKIAQVSTGDMFREEMNKNTNLGKTVAGFLNRGELIPDSIVIKLLDERIRKSDSAHGFILDGYPRTLEQASALEKISEIDAIIRIIVPSWIIVERLTSRRVCRECGAVFNIRYLTTKKPGVCDECGGQLFQREDDKPWVIKERLSVYEAETRPLIDYYAEKIPLIEVECKSLDIPPETMVERILHKLLKANLIPQR